MYKGSADERPAGLWTTILLGSAALLLVLAVVSSPEPAFQASLQALKLWWNIVFPALLPFLVLTEIMMAYGWAHGAGSMLDPVMRKCFRLPGAGGWVLMTGMIAGFPAGAKAAASLVKQGGLSPQDALKIAALSHFCNPMTILIVIGTGLLRQPAAGYVLLTVHWGAGLLAAWTLAAAGARRNRRKAPGNSSKPGGKPRRSQASVLSRAAAAAAEARRQDGRSFGRLLGDSVTSSVQTLMLTGGFIMIFAVAVNVLSHISWIPPFITAGLLEMHIGAQAASTAYTAGSGLQLALISALLAWSGFSAHLQTLSALGLHGRRWGTFTAQRLLHTAYAFGLTLLLWKPAGSLTSAVLPAFGPVPSDAGPQERLFDLWNGFAFMLQWQLLAFILLSVLLSLASRIIDRHSR